MFSDTEISGRPDDENKTYQDLAIDSQRALLIGNSLGIPWNLASPNGVLPIMRMRWRLILPVIGLILFGAETYSSLRLNRQLGTVPRKYYYWSSIDLDSDPLNRSSAYFRSRDSGAGTWGFQTIWVDPGYLTKALMLSALPAFVVGVVVTSGLARLGVSEVWSFMVAMPASIVAWFYFVGWLFDRLFRRRSRPGTLTSD